jgi:hypothetical protein
MDLINLILSYPVVQFLISLVEILAPLIFLFFIGVIIISLTKGSYIKMSFWTDWVEFLKVKGYQSGKIEKRWALTAQKLESDNPADWKLAIIEAESLLEGVLARMGFGGESFGERLKKIKEEQMPGLNNVIQAHQVRNNIVHDPDYRLDIGEASKALAAYEKALKELDVL